MRRRKLLAIVSTVFVGLVGIYIAFFLYAPYSLAGFFVSDDSRGIYITLKPFGIIKEITGNSHYKSHDLYWSPQMSYISFFERVMEPSVKPYDREWALKIANPRTLKIKTVFIGDSNTSEYQWLNENTIRVFMNGGTGVRIYHDVNILEEKPFVAVEHKSPKFWIPIKVS